MHRGRHTDVEHADGDDHRHTHRHRADDRHAACDIHRRRANPNTHANTTQHGISNTDADTNQRRISNPDAVLKTECDAHEFPRVPTSSHESR
jgi:hypothetical protein